MSLAANHAAALLPPPALAAAQSAVDLPPGYALGGGSGHYYWTRGELVGPVDPWGSSKGFRASAEEVAADARAHASAHPLVVLKPARTPPVAALTERLLSARRLRAVDLRALERLALDERYALRAAVLGGSDYGPGTARQAIWNLGNLGAGSSRVESRDLLRAWRAAHERVDPLGWSYGSDLHSEIRADGRDRLSKGASEDWRRALVDAFDAVRRPHMSTEDQARAWSPISARWLALHLLGVELAELAERGLDLSEVVRGWLPGWARRDRPRVLGAGAAPV